MHTHAFPDTIAPRAMESLSSMADWEPYGDGTIDDSLRSMDEAGVGVSAVCGIATKAGQVVGILKWLEQITHQHPGRLIPFVSLHPDDENPYQWFTRFESAGVSSLKLHAFYQDFVVDDESMFPIYEAAVERGFLVAFHCGMDIGFKNDPLPDRASPARIANVAARFPKMKILCTHTGGWMMWDKVAEYLLETNVYFETSCTMSFFGVEKFVDLVRVLGVERVCFGTDWPWQDRSEELHILRRSGLENDELEQIFSLTAGKLAVALS